jgi:hypothetical protein
MQEEYYFQERNYQQAIRAYKNIAFIMCNNFRIKKKFYLASWPEKLKITLAKGRKRAEWIYK